MFTLDTIRDVATFERLEHEWDELLSDSGADCVFLTWEWLFTWWRHLAGHKQLSILVVRSEGRLMGLAPFALGHAWYAPLRRLGTLDFIGSGQVGGDYLDVIARRGHEDGVLDTIARHLGTLSTTLALTQVDSTTGLAWVLGRALESHGWTASQAVTSVCPFINLRSLDWPAYLEGRSAAVRYNFRRRLRGLGRRGAVTFDAAATNDARRAILARLVEFHLERWERRGGSDGFNSVALLAFHEEFTQLALARGWLRLFALRVEGAPVAVLYCLRYRGAMLFYQSGFDGDWARHSVGLVAMGLAIKAAIEEGAIEYDLLHGDESYKFHWAGDAREIGRLELYPADVFGSLYHRTVELKRATRRVARAIRSRLSLDHVASVS